MNCAHPGPCRRLVHVGLRGQIFVDRELQRIGVEAVRIDWTSGRDGAHVDLFVGRSLTDLARFLAWSEAAGISVGEVASEEGENMNVNTGETLVGLGRRAVRT
jgi:hypothetical protein